MLTPKPTKAQSAKYLKDLALKCPYCGKDDLNAGVVQFANDDLAIHRDAFCYSCCARWRETFAMTGIVSNPSEDSLHRSSPDWQD